MYRVKLINMPFATVDMPSLALTQLKSQLDTIYPDQCTTSVHYLNHDFANYIGVQLYQRIATSGQHHNTGVGDWFFRQAAFPSLPDNTETYFRRYYPQNSGRIQQFKQTLREKRQGLDAFLDQLITKYDLAHAEIVGFTSMFSQNTACFALARRLKERNPSLLVIMGGANCEAPMGQEIVTNIDTVDFVFSGPGLQSLPDFVSHCLNHSPEKCHTIAGVFSKRNCALRSFRDAHGDYSYREAIGKEVSLDTEIDVDYTPFLDALDNAFPQQQIKPILPFETSRGCWWGQRAHCTFCGLNGSTMAYRAMESANALKLFQKLFSYASRCSTLSCVDNIVPKNYFTDVFPRLNTPENMKIFYEVKADLSETDIQTLAKAHVRSIQPGIEALATSTLKLMRKGTTAFQNLRLLRFCAQYDVYPTWNLLVGFPGEKEQTYQTYTQLIPLITHLPPPSGVYPVRFDRFSPYFTDAEAYNLELSPSEFYELIYPFSKQSLQNMAYYFADNNLDADYIVTMLNSIGKVRREFDLWHKLWFDNEHGVPPVLFLKQEDQQVSICDSRSGRMIEYTIDSASKDLLLYLMQSRKLTELQGSDSEKYIPFLRQKGLLFEEDGRIMSLVFPESPQLMDVLATRTSRVTLSNVPV